MNVYGTLSIRPRSALRFRENRLDRIVVDAEPEVIDIIQRLIPSYNTSPFSVVASQENVRLLRMIMREYPLKVRGEDLWNEIQIKTDKQKELEFLLTRHSPVTPSPQRFAGVLLPFQKIGLDFLLKTDGVALMADEMGLGKTVQTLAFVAQRPECMPTVIVAPLVTLQNWKREIERFLRIEKEGGEGRNSAEATAHAERFRLPRIQLMRTGSKTDKIAPADFYLINYELVHKRVSDIKSFGPRLVVFDEIQNLRNPDTRKFAACSMLAEHETVRHKIGLSGTPIYNRGLEMYGIGEIIKPGVLGERDEFIRQYCDAYDMEETLMAKRTSLARLLQKSMMIRRRKTEVMPDLPEKNRLQQEVAIDTAMYESRIKKMYIKIDQARRRMNAYKTEEERRRGLLELNSHLLEMRVTERQIAGLAKAPYIVEYISKLLEDYEEEKFVVFCHHRSVHKILLDGLWSFMPLQIIGGQSDKARQQAIDDFQNKPGRRVIICGLRAGNVGISLTSASYVIFAEMDWSPAIHLQAEDRLHRIGQKRAVFSHYLVGLGTFDEYLADLLVSKSVEISSVLGENPEATNNKKALELLEKKFGINVSVIANDSDTSAAGSSKRANGKKGGRRNTRL